MPTQKLDFIWRWGNKCLWRMILSDFGTDIFIFVKGISVTALTWSNKVHYCWCIETDDGPTEHCMSFHITTYKKNCLKNPPKMYNYVVVSPSGFWNPLIFHLQTFSFMSTAFSKTDNIFPHPIHLPSFTFTTIPSSLSSPSWCKSHQWAEQSSKIPSFWGRRLGVSTDNWI